MAEQHKPRCRGCSIQTSQMLAFLRERVENTSRSQTLLAMSRMQLLVKRERLRSAGHEVKVKRVAAGDAESAFMSKLRSFIYENWSDLPSGLLEAYDKVERSRDVLGVIEEEYLQDERDLAGEEWKVMDQENKFYQFDLYNTLPARSDHSVVIQRQDDRAILFPPHPPPPPPPPPCHLSANQLGPLSSREVMMLPPTPPPPPLSTHLTSLSMDLCPRKVPSGRYCTIAKEVNNLRNAFNQLRKERAHEVQWAVGDEVLLSDGPGLPNGHPKADLTLPEIQGLEILDKLHVREVTAQKLKPQDEIIFDGLPTGLRRNSDSARCYQSGDSCATSMRRTQTESAVSMLKEDPIMKEKIREWSFEYMRMNIVEQRHYLNALEKEGVRDSMDVDWKGRAAQFWGIDSATGNGEMHNPEASSTENVSLGAGSCNGGIAIADPGFSAFPRDEEEFDESDLSYSDYDGTSVVFIPLEDQPLQDEAARIPLPPSPPPLHEPTNKLEANIPSLVVTVDPMQTSGEHQIPSGDAFAHCHTSDQPLLGLDGSHHGAERKDSCREEDEIKKEEPKAQNIHTSCRSLPEWASLPGHASRTVASHKRRESMPQLTTKTSFTVSEFVTEGTNICNHPTTSDIKIEIPPRDKVLSTSPSSRPKNQRRKSAGTILRNTWTRVFKAKIGRSKSTPDIKEHESLGGR